MLIKNYEIKDARVEVPALVVRPPGLIVFYPSNAGGIFRSQGDTWEQLKKQGQRYGLAHPNPIKLVLERAVAVQAYLTGKQVESKNIEPVVYLVNPEIHVDSYRPVVGMVMPDALERYISGFFSV